MKRLPWLDISKALAICWVVYFHFFTTCFEHYTLPPNDWSGIVVAAITALRLAWFQVSGLGFHAVGVFIILSGWTLMRSTLHRAERNEVAWSTWYGARFLRLYPMYWVAHLIYLISPFVERLEPIDGRIVLSLLGLRFVDITMNFMYLNAAWWYFSMLIQFCLLFPLLFWAARRFGASIFLVTACALGFFMRYLLLEVYPQHGFWILGGFAVCRLPEFALGMGLAMWHRQSPARLEWFLLRGTGFVAGLLLYPAALQLYANGATYVFCDFASSGCCFLEIVGVAGIVAHVRSLTKVFCLIGSYSYGLYLIHQPYVIWLGLRIRPQPILMFLLIFLAALAVLSAWGILLEKTTNAVIARILPRKVGG